MRKLILAGLLATPLLLPAPALAAGLPPRSDPGPTEASQPSMAAPHSTRSPARKKKKKAPRSPQPVPIVNEASPKTMAVTSVQDPSPRRAIWPQALLAAVLGVGGAALLVQFLVRSLKRRPTEALPGHSTATAAHDQVGPRFERAWAELQALPHMGPNAYEPGRGSEAQAHVPPPTGMCEGPAAAQFEYDIDPDLDEAINAGDGGETAGGGDEEPLDESEAWQRQALEALRAAVARDPSALFRRVLLNREEWPLFEEVLDRWAQSKQLRLMAQVSMGEFIRTRKGPTDTDELYRAFGSKRVDFLICDWRLRPIVAVEYFGAGHGQGTADLRDAIKREVLEAVKIPLVVVPEVYSAKAVCDALDAALVQARAVGKVQKVFAMAPRAKVPRRWGT